MLHRLTKAYVSRKSCNRTLQNKQLLELVKEHVSKAVEKTKNKIKRTTTNADFKVSDRVLRANISNHQRKGGKLEANYLGSCVITAIQDQSTNLQGSKRVIISKVNIGHVKLHWCLKKTSGALSSSFMSPQPEGP